MYICIMEIKRGGKRAGAGRKPLGLKKKSVFLYVEGNLILKFGGEEKMKEKLYDFIKAYGEHNDKAWAGKLIEGETEPYKNFGVFVPQEPKRMLIRSFEQYKQLRVECENEEDWAELSNEIRNSNLSTKQKQLLLN